jgi:hypothetical protein
MGLFPAVSWAQAAAEYGLAAGKSAGAVSGAASVLNKASRRMADSIGQKTSRATSTPASQTKARPRAVAAVPQKAPAATQVSTANAVTTVPPSSALVIETGQGTIRLDDRSTAAQRTTPDPKAKAGPTQNRYDSVISLPAQK